MIKFIKKIIKYDFISLSLTDYLAARKGAKIRLAAKKNGFDVKRLLIIKLDHLGDYILFRNFLKRIRESEKFKNYKITFLGNIILKELAEKLDSKYVDEFIWINLKDFFTEYKSGYRYNVIKKVSSLYYDIAFQPSYSRNYFWGDSIMRAVDAGEKIGFDGDLNNLKGVLKKKADSFYSRLIKLPDNVVFEFDKNRFIVDELLKNNSHNINLPFIETVPAFLKHESGEYCVIFAGASSARRRWGIEKFAKVADYIVENSGYKIFLAGSTAEENLAFEVSAAMKSEKKEIICRTAGLFDTACLLAGAAVVICGDTGAVHMAMAAGAAKVICISNANHYLRFVPYPAGLDDRLFCVFPDVIDDMIVKKGVAAVIEAFKYGSDIDINLVSADKVIRILNEK